MFRLNKTGLTDNFRSKIALNMKTGKGIVIEDELRSGFFFLPADILRSYIIAEQLEKLSLVKFMSYVVTTNR